MKGDVAYVLPVEAANTAESQHYGFMSGLWTPGERNQLADLDETEEQMDALIEEHQLPLEKVKAVSDERARLEAMKLDELKAEAEKRNVGVAGSKKKNYVDALEAADAAAGPPPVEAPGDPAAVAEHEAAADGGEPS